MLFIVLSRNKLRSFSEARPREVIVMSMPRIAFAVSLKLEYFLISTREYTDHANRDRDIKSEIGVSEAQALLAQFPSARNF